ncbi:MAG: hypothetical protein ACOCXS_00045 [Bacteroidota bacterium]
MKEKKLLRFTATASILFALLCIAWVALSLFFLPVSQGQDDYTFLILAPGWDSISAIGLLASLFGVFSVAGIYAIHYNQKGFLFPVGTLLLLLGLLLEFGALTWDTFVWPALVTDDRGLAIIRENVFIESVQFWIFFIALLVFLLVGTIFFSIALWKSRVYGKMIPVLLVLGIILYVAGSATVVYISSIGLTIYSLAFFFIGVKLNVVKA